MEKRLFTSESVCMGHPDKVADAISDSILDAHLEGDPHSRVACETMVSSANVIIAGEITSKSRVPYEEVAGKAIQDIGYNSRELGFSGDTCKIQVFLNPQSPDISAGVTEGEGLHKEQGAGDQGMMFGFACNETAELMPFPIYYAHRMVERMADARKSGEIAWLRPDGKCQLTVEYEGGKPARVHTVVISTQHDPSATLDEIRSVMVSEVALRVIPPEYLDEKTVYHINPTGRFVVGGPVGDAGLTGRKIIVDTYGGRARHGGGAFSGKDPSKVDRSAAYAARWVAKNVVAAGLCEQVEVQIAYAIGVAQPVAVGVDTFGTGNVSDEKITSLIRDHFDLTPKGIISSLNLLRPVYRETSYHGHFGRKGPGFTWEKTDKAEILSQAAGLNRPAAV